MKQRVQESRKSETTQTAEERLVAQILENARPVRQSEEKGSGKLVVPLLAC